MLLPPERAFLLQLTDRATPSIGSFAGRLEHLASGTRRRFSGWDAFLTAVDALLAEHGGRTRRRRSVTTPAEATPVHSRARSGRTACRPPSRTD
ncbi:MAG: hypothetical protein SF182_11490 [Deltaproteobacteria bacterium]|nr:hypothetical protein [Deltaproteobacteria bacterium]